MRHRTLYHFGKIVQRTFEPVERFFGKIAFWGMNLWDANCPCEKCIKRDSAR